MRTRLVPALLLCLALPACTDREADRAGRVPLAAAGVAATGDTAAVAADSRSALPADAAAALDRANADFRAGRYAAALAGYRAAAVRAPAHAAPHYGIYMVARQARDAALADSAMAAIRARTPAASQLADSTLAAVHAGGTATALPPGHPAVAPKGTMPNTVPGTMPGTTLPQGHPPMKARTGAARTGA